MAVYTQLEMAELAEAVAPLGLGELVTAQGVAAGIENTTYFLTFSPSDQHTQIQEFVLTISETLSAPDIEFVATVTSYLERYGAPVPAPVATALGRRVLSIGGKPALIIPKILGNHPEQPTPAQCDAIGRAVAQCHAGMQQAGFAHRSHRGLDWVAATGPRLLGLLGPVDQALLSAELLSLAKFVNTHNQLPCAVIHGDLFRDNALFIGDRLTAIIDFFSAGTGYLMFDLAVIANDWCLLTSAVGQSQCLRALTAGYAAVRMPDAAEQQLWPDFLAIAALRFWVSRLADRLLVDHRPVQLRADKDPNEYRELLLQHRRSPIPWV